APSPAVADLGFSLDGDAPGVSVCLLQALLLRVGDVRHYACIYRARHDGCHATSEYRFRSVSRRVVRRSAPPAASRHVARFSPPACSGDSTVFLLATPRTVPTHPE